MQKTLRISLMVLSMSLAGMGVFAQILDDGPMATGQITQYESLSNDAKADLNPVILEVVNEINSDSIRATIQHLQDFGTRFLLKDNRKEIATWIANKFISYGFTDVVVDSFLCYVNWSGIFVDTLWQYNIVATLTGQSAPDEIYVVGGHYDAIVLASLDTTPGADDNGSGTAATMEIARAMKQINYQPESTIKFCLFAAEELGLYGSKYQAMKAHQTGEDVRFMLNMDMIANNPDSLNLVTIFRYQFFEWASILAADAIENCNIDYCADISQGACAILMVQQFLPFPQGIVATSTKEHIVLSWDPTENALIDGFNLYRSETMNGVYDKINQALIADTFYMDAPSETGVEYFYYLKMVNNLGEESMASDKVWGARFGFTDTLLVVATHKGSNVTPDSVYQYYASVLDTTPFTWFDYNEIHPIDLGTLARYRNVLWLTQDFITVQPTDTVRYNLNSFFQNGGNMFVSGFIPTKFWANNTHYPFKFPEDYFISRIFKIDSVDKQINSFMYKAYPSAEGYDTVHVDQGKSLTPEFPGELFNIEVFTPTAEGSVIYRFDSRWDPSTSQGKMQNHPVHD